MLSEGSPDPELGELDLSLNLKRSQIKPVAWGGQRLLGSRKREKQKKTILVWGRKREKILENVLNNSKWERKERAPCDGVFSAFKLNTSAY